MPHQRKLETPPPGDERSREERLAAPKASVAIEIPPSASERGRSRVTPEAE
jgi:hypothetical protein